MADQPASSISGNRTSGGYVIMALSIICRVISRRRRSMSPRGSTAASAPRCAHMLPPAASRACTSAPSKRCNERDRALDVGAGAGDRPRVATGVGDPSGRAGRIEGGDETVGERRVADRAPSARPRGRGIETTVEQRGADLVVVPVDEIGRARARRGGRAFRSHPPRRAWPSSAATARRTGCRRARPPARRSRRTSPTPGPGTRSRCWSRAARPSCRARRRPGPRGATTRARRSTAAGTTARLRSGTAPPRAAPAARSPPRSTRSSSGRNHCACDGAYLECVASTSMRSPAASMAETCRLSVG